MQRRVVVTGLGVVSPVGCTVRSAWDTIISGKSCLTSIDDPEYEKLPCKVAAYARHCGTKLKLSDRFGKSQLRSAGAATCYALLAAEEAIAESRLELDDGVKENSGVAVGMGMVDLLDICSANDALRKGFVERKNCIVLGFSKALLE